MCDLKEEFVNVAAQSWSRGKGSFNVLMPKKKPKESKKKRFRNLNLILYQHTHKKAKMAAFPYRASCQ